MWPRFMYARTLMVGCAAGEEHLDGKDEFAWRCNAQLLASAIVREARAQIEHGVEGFAIVVRKTRKLGQTGRVEPIVKEKIKRRAVDKWHQMTPAPPSITRIWPLI